MVYKPGQAGPTMNIPCEFYVFHAVADLLFSTFEMGFKAAIIGGSGNVGRCIVRRLIANPECEKVVMLGRGSVEEFASQPKVSQQTVNVNDIRSESSTHLGGVSVAFCTMGVGKPAKVCHFCLCRNSAIRWMSSPCVCSPFGLTFRRPLQRTSKGLTVQSQANSPLPANRVVSVIFRF